MCCNLKCELIYINKLIYFYLTKTDIIAGEGNLYNKSKCEPCGQNAPGYGNLGYVSSSCKACQLCESLKSCLLSSLNFEAVDCKRHIIKEFWYLRLTKNELRTFLMPRQNFKSVWMQSRCVVPAWSWWDLRTGFLRLLESSWSNPMTTEAVVQIRGGLGPLWASLEEQWLHWDMGSGAGVLLASPGGEGLGWIQQVLCWCQRRQWLSGWPWWHQVTSCLMHRVKSAWFRVAMRKVPWSQDQLPRRVKISACRSKN